MTTTPGGVIDDIGMRWKLIVMTIAIEQMQGMLDDATSGVPKSLGAGTAEILALPAASELSAFAMDDLDEVYFGVPIQKFWEFDLDEDIHVQLLGEFTDSGAVANVDLTLHAKGVLDGVPSSDAKVSPDATIIYPALAGVASGQIFKTAIIPMDARGVFKLDDRILFAVTLADKGTGTALKVFLTEAVFYGSRQSCNESGREST